jgi:peroxiredoxin
VDLVTLRGKVVLLDFWATDCPPCMEQFTELKELFERYKELGLEIIGISSDKDPKRPERVLRQKGIPWPNFASTEGPSNEHCVAFGVSGIPDVFLIDRNGILREAGAIQNLENKIKFLLKRVASSSVEGLKGETSQPLSPLN